MAKAKPTTDHVVCHSGDKPGGMAYALECRHCGTLRKVKMPMSADLYVTLTKAFVRLHTPCKISAQGLAKGYYAHVEAVGLLADDEIQEHARKIREQTICYARAAGIAVEDVLKAIGEVSE